MTGITDATGTLINTTKYDSYGHILSQSNPVVADQLAFTGRELDSETGLYYLRARYYDPQAGRFQSEDPKGTGAGDFNFNRYATNNPLLYVDRYGLDTTEEILLNEQSKRNAIATSVFGYVVANQTLLASQRIWDARIVAAKGWYKTFIYHSKFTSIIKCVAAVTANYIRVQAQMLLLAKAVEAELVTLGAEGTYGALAVEGVYIDARRQATLNWKSALVGCYGAGFDP